MLLEEILDLKTSYQANVEAPLSAEYSIKEILEFIKKGKHKEEILSLRKFLDEGQKEHYDINKKRLSGVTFCALFDKRRKGDRVKSYNNLFVLDIDKLSDEQLEQVKEQIATDDFVFSYWESPSKRGIKGLVYVSYENTVQSFDKYHKEGFSSLLNYFSENYGIVLDKSGSDITRLCFLSYDPNLIIKQAVMPFVVTLNTPPPKKINEKLSTPAKNAINDKAPPKLSKDILFNPKGRNAPHHRATMQSILKFLMKKDLSITNSYDNWLRVAFAIADSFTFDIGEKYFLRLCRLDKEGHDELKSRELLQGCYKSTKKRIGFNTIVFLAKQKGYKDLGGTEGG